MSAPKLWTGLLVGALAMSGCYTHQRIAVEELEKLTAAPGRPPEVVVKGVECGDCQVQVEATSPLVLTTRDGVAHRMTPFYFHMSDTQLVSPDYGVLVNRADLQRAEVRQLSTGGTLALVGLIAGVALGTFVAIQATAGEESLRSED